jgi:CubicO group peptidase (beta-lactamase class C family)
MRINFYLLILLLSFSGASAQTSLRQKADAYASRVVSLYNRSAFDSLYHLGGSLFKKRWPYEMYFRGRMHDQHSVYGQIVSYTFRQIADSTVYYVASFKNAKMDLGITVNREGQLEDFFLAVAAEIPAQSEAVAPQEKRTNIAALDRKTDSLSKTFLSNNKAASIAVGVLTNGNLHSYGYGETVIGNKTAPTKFTLYEIGSISKTFTGILLAYFAQQEIVKLDDPVNKYLPDSIPELSYNGKKVTLASLSNHSSGLPRLPGNMFEGADMMNPYKNYDEQKLFRFLKNFKLQREPGAQYDYSNLAVGLLGTILERVSGKSYEQLVKEIITEPLEMSNTRLTLTESGKQNFAQAYNRDRAVNSWEFQALAAAGGIRSCVRDMLLYAKAQLDGGNTPLAKAIALSHQLTFEKDGKRVGLGWHFVTSKGKKYVFHNGQTGGYCSALVVNPETKNAVVMLTNSTTDPMGTAMELINWLDQ